MAALADFGDRQWLQALAAVLIGLWLAGGAAQRSGLAGVAGPLSAVGAALDQAHCAAWGGAATGMTVIMPVAPRNRG